MTRASVRRVHNRHEQAGSLIGDEQEQAENDIQRTTHLDDLFIMSTSFKNRGLIAIQLNQQLHEFQGVNISKWTVR